MVLRLIHQSPDTAPIPAGAVAWRTCLREVVFVGSAATSGPHAVIADADAYSLLVEVVSGLRSPLIGETEVQAQFKAFLESLDAERHAGLRKLGQRVLADVKTIRRRYLQGVGAHSYASLAIGHIDPRAHVAVIGTGALAASILDALGSRTVDQWGRRPDVMTSASPARRYRLFGDRPDDPPAREATLVIAAPVDAAPLDAVVRAYARIAKTIDLRPADARTACRTCGPVVTLDDLFADAGDAASSGRATFDAARADIRRLAHAYHVREELHPLGWDDLCA